MAATDDSDIPESGAVFTFGKSKFAENLPNKFWVKNDRVLQVSCGDEHTALVAESGRVFMFGPNNWGELGIGSATKVANKPSCIKSLKSEKSRLVACGRHHSIIATESGKIYTFGANNDGQLGIDGLTSTDTPKHVDSLEDTQYKMVAAGSDHSMALTEDGRLFVWGSNGEGQVGLGEESEVSVPTQLDVGQRVTCIACGYYHSAIVTENGELYTFGETEEGQLGLGDDTEEPKIPQQVVAISDKVKAVACGSTHTVVLTEKGQVYTFGGGASGQLGLGVSVLSSPSPSLLKLPFKVSQICCGENFTALISEKGQLYTFGDGRHGKLALGQESFANQFVPSRVDRFTKFVVNRVACGGCHMIVTATPKLENGDVESEEEEEMEKPYLNGSLRVNKSLDLTGTLERSFSARDRRRNASPGPLYRTLPALGSTRPLPALHATVPAIQNHDQHIKPAVVPRLETAKKKGKTHKEEDEEEEESEEEESEDEAEPAPKATPRKVPPRPSESGDEQKEEKADDENKDKKSDEEEEEEEEDLNEKDAEADDQVENADSAVEADDEKESEKEEKKAEVVNGKPGSDWGSDSEMEEDELAQKQVKEEEEGDREEDEKEEGSDLEDESGLKKKPVPIPRSSKEEAEDEGSEEEEEEEEKEKEKEKDSKKDKKKDKKKSKKDEKDEDEDEEEEEEKGKKKKDKKDKKKDKKDKKKKKGKDEEEEEDEDEGDEEEKGKDKSKKGKDKKDKKEKEDKKKKKKGKKDEEEEEEDEDKDEEKDKKKSKEKDKKKNKDEKDKDKKKDKEDKEEDEEKEKEEKKEEVPPPKKKSRFCTVL